MKREHQSGYPGREAGISQPHEGDMDLKCFCFDVDRRTPGRGRV